MSGSTGTPGQRKPGQKADDEQDRLDETIEDSFPASDPPSKNADHRSRRDIGRRSEHLTSSARRL